MSDERELADGAAGLGLALSASQYERLVSFAAMLRRWNRAFNLISRRDVDRLLPRHVFDSLALAGLLRGLRVVDLGTGAGLPGIPLAVACPAVQFTLLDRSERRIRFVNSVARELMLENVDAQVADYRRFRPSELFDTVVSRAVADARTVWKAAQPLLASGGQALLQVGADDHLVGHGCRVERIEMQIPGLIESHFVLRVVKLPAPVASP